jgi:hypothetical protein
MEANTLNSVEAMRMFSIIATVLEAKPERRSLSERVMDFVAALHAGGFLIVPNPDGAENNHE